MAISIECNVCFFNTLGVQGYSDTLARATRLFSDPGAHTSQPVDAADVLIP